MAGIPIMIARPFGSTARYWPGTIRRQPLFPKVSWCTWYHSQQAILQVLLTLDFIYHCFQTFKQLFQHQKKQSLPINQPIKIALAETAWKSGKHFNEDISKWRGQWQGGCPSTNVLLPHWSQCLHQMHRCPVMHHLTGDQHPDSQSICRHSTVHRRCPRWH